MRLYCTFLFLLLLSVTATAQVTIFDFEGAAPSYTDLGSVTTIIDNPDATEPNTSAKVAQNVVPAGAAFATVKFIQPIDFADGKKFTMLVWSPIEDAPVLLKFEDGAGPDLEREATFTGPANSWQELTFDFITEPDASFGSIVIFMNFNVVASEELTFYWDDLVQIFVAPPAGTQMDLPVTFDDPNVNYGLIAFEGGASAIVADPENPDNQVGQFTKTPDSGTSAGTTVTSEPGGPVGFASRIPFTATETTMSVRVWSPTANIPVRLKVEKADDPTISVETQTMLTVANTWDTLVFDFAMEATGTAELNLASFYNKASIFFDFGSVPGAVTDYYFDDMSFGGISGGGGGGDEDAQMDLPVTFDEEGVDYGVDDFGGAESMIVADPEDATNTAVQFTKTAGATVFAGTTLNSTSGGPPGFASPVPFTADATKMALRVWSPTAGTPVLLKVENVTDPAISVETLMSTTVAGEWEVLVFDFSEEAPGTAALSLSAIYDKASIFFDFGSMPTEATTYYFDDLYFGDVVSTNEPLTGLLEVFPNPTADEFSIIAPERMESLILFSGNGSKVGEWRPMTERFTLEASHLAPGMYVALVRTQRGLMTVKVMKK